jgi:ABC transporter with metal-binding/Fe-S-binding domain ATP-binding protein
VRLAALCSGGKDSTFSIFKAKEAGHEIACLLSLRPSSDDSLLFHYPNIYLTDLSAKAMGISLYTFNIEKSSKEAEVEALEEALQNVKSRYDVQGIIHGAISSNFQNQVFKTICDNIGLTAVAPIWNISPLQYMNELLSSKFNIIIVSVSAMGLEKCWLGKRLDHNTFTTISSLSKKFGFNLAFEGGEAETLVLDCPLFEKEKISIHRAKVHWDGQRGMFEILEASLVPKNK